MDVNEYIELDGLHGRIVTRVRRHPSATHLAVIAHGYGEHGGRYAHVADTLAAGGATVVTPDHYGHGLSDGDRSAVRDGDEYVTDLHTVVRWANGAFPGLPVVMIGHSMGGLIATRYAQEHCDQLAALALSGPIVGGMPGFGALAAMDSMPVESGDVTPGRTRAADPPGWYGPFEPVALLAAIRSVDAIAAGPGFGSLPTLWLHSEADPLAPLEVARAAMRRLRGDVFEERVYAGAAHEIFSEANNGESLSDLARFVAETISARGSAHRTERHGVPC